MPTFYVEWSCVNVVKTAYDPSLEGRKNVIAPVQCSGMMRVEAPSFGRAERHCHRILVDDRRTYDVRVRSIGGDDTQ